MTLDPPTARKKPGEDGIHKFWWRHKLQLILKEPHIYFQKHV
jgi:hypothetical protein